MGSDHCPFTCVVNTECPPVKDFSRWDVRKLLDGETRSLFVNRLQSTQQRCLNDMLNKSVEDQWRIFKDWIGQAAEESCGSIKVKTRTLRRDFWTPTLLAQQREIDIARRNLVEYPLPPMFQASLRHQLLSQEHVFQAAIKQRRKQLFQETVTNLCQPQAKNSFMKLISCRQARRKRTQCALDPTNLDQYGAHFQSTFAGEPTATADTTPVQPYIAGTVNAARVMYHLQWAPMGKASGVDDIPGEFYNYGAMAISPVFSALAQSIQDTNTLPSDWLQAKICPIFKGKGLPNDIANYRPIALTCVARRIYERLILDELEPFTSQLQDLQGGFRPNRSTYQQIFSLQEVIRHNPKVHMVFLDLKAAYDMVPRQRLWHKLLTQFHIPYATVQRLQALFDHNTSHLVVGGHTGPDIANARGLLQGSSLSPILFNFYIDDLIAKLHAEAPLSSVNDFKLNSLWFADDGCIFSRSLDTLKLMLHICEEWAMINGMQFAPTKCVYLGPKWQDGPTDLHLYLQQLPAATSFTYLGVTFDKSGINWPLHLEGRMDKSVKTAKILRVMGLHIYGWPITSSCLIYKLFIRPVWEYGLCLSAMTKAEMTPLLHAQRMALRTMFTANKLSSNAAMHKLAYLEPVETRIQVLQARFISSLHNTVDGRIPAACIWRACLAKTKPSFPVKASKHPWWSDIPKFDHPTHPLTRDATIIAQTKVQRIPSSYIRKKIQDSILSLDGRVADAISLDPDIPVRHITRNECNIPVTQRTTIYQWLLGNVCRHQICKNCNEMNELSRLHGVRCSGAHDFLHAQVPLYYNDLPGDTLLDALLNAAHNGPPDDCSNAYDLAFETISMIYRKCRGLEINSNGFWQPPHTLPPPINPDQPNLVAPVRDRLRHVHPPRNEALPRHLRPPVFRQPAHRRQPAPPRPRPSLDEIFAATERQIAQDRNNIDPSIAHHQFVPCQPLTRQDKQRLKNRHPPQPSVLSAPNAGPSLPPSLPLGRNR